MQLETGDLGHPVGKASAAHLEYIRSVVSRLAEDAGIPDPETSARSWRILMKRSIIAAAEGDVMAAQRARAMGELVLDHHLPHELDLASDENAADAKLVLDEPGQDSKRSILVAPLLDVAAFGARLESDRWHG